MKLLERMFEAADTTKPFECFVLHINKINFLRRKVGRPVWLVHCICFSRHDKSEIRDFKCCSQISFKERREHNVFTFVSSLCIFSEYLAKNCVLI